MHRVLPRHVVATATLSHICMSGQMPGRAELTACCPMLQDAQGHDLCQYREFDPSEQDESEGDEEQWHSQKKGCCTIM